MRDANRLDIRASIERPRNAASVHSQPSSVQPTVRSSTVLVVDDDAGVRRVASQILEAGGYRVLRAKDGLEAVSLYRSSARGIDVVLLDVVMPKLDGLEAFKQLVAFDPDVRVVFQSGEERSVLGELEELASGFLHKPYGPRALLQAVAETIRD